MALTKITGDVIAANTISAEKIASTVELGGPKISNVQIANSSWSALDDTAVSLDGGYILINGTGFVSGASVLVNNVPVTSAAVVNSSIIRAEVPSANAGTYVAYVVNPDGGTAIGVNALTYSATPTWVTGSTLNTQQVDVEISIALEATGATSYALADGSTLPANTTLASNGLFSGTVTGLEVETNYSFTVVATDNENQDSPRTFSVTVTTIVADEYFNSTVLLLQADGTSNTAQNQTFIDSSTNALTITRNGNATQGSFSPFSPTGWSNYFDGTGDHLTIASNTAIDVSTGDFTIEAWVYPITRTNTVDSVFGYGTYSMMLYQNGSNWALEVGNGSSNYFILSSNSINFHSWTHIAITRNGNNFNLWVNGNSVATNSTASSIATSSKTLYVGLNYSGSTQAFTGNISNFRIVKGTALYTSNFTPSTTPLTAVSGTSLLTCRSNRFIDNSTNNFAITRNGDAKVVAFSPFAPAEAYSPATHGGSAYFDGAGDELTLGTNSILDFGTGNFTIEAWVWYPADVGTNNNEASIISNGGSFTTGSIRIGITPGGGMRLYLNGAGDIIYDTGVVYTSYLEQWIHWAVVRSGNTFTLYKNGASVSTGTYSGSINFGGTGTRIGGNWSSTGMMKGYISNFRAVKGTALYTSNFTPPTTAPEAIANTSLLLNFTNAGISDATTKNVVETVGNAQVSTSVKKYGTGSIAFDGTGDYLYCVDSPNNEFGSGNLTWEMWINTTSSTQYATLYSRTPASFSTGMWVLLINASSATAGDVALYLADYSTSTPILLTTGVNVRDGNWHHIAVVRDGSSWVLYVDGTSRATQTWSGTITDIAYGPYIGADQFYARHYNGYIDDLRITKGVARYTSNFTVPDKEFPIQ